MRLRSCFCPTVIVYLTTVQYWVRALAVKFYFFFIRSLLCWLFVFLLIPNLIFYSTIRGLTKFKAHRSLSD